MIGHSPEFIVLIVTQEGIVSKKKHVRHFLNVFFFLEYLFHKIRGYSSPEHLFF